MSHKEEVREDSTTPVASEEVPTMIDLAHRIQDDDIDSISDCSSCGDDKTDVEMDLQPIPMDSDDWRDNSNQAIVFEVLKPDLCRQTSQRTVPSIISFEADEGDHDAPMIQKVSFSFPETPATSMEEDVPQLVMSPEELGMDDRSIATFSLVDESDQPRNDSMSGKGKSLGRSPSQHAIAL